MIKLKSNPLETDLLTGKVLKTDDRVIFFGEVDCLSAYIMDLTHSFDEKDIKNKLIMIVRNLSTLMGEVAGGVCHIGEMHLQELLDFIKEAQIKSGPFTGFVLPGNTPLSAKLHIVRTIARKAELAYARVYEKYGGNDYAFEYLNKLSTLFFALATIYEK